MPKRIFILTDLSYKPIKMLLNNPAKLAKGFIRLGNDVRIFSCNNALSTLSPFKSKKISKYFYKSRIDKLLADQIKKYEPDIIYIGLPKVIDADTIECMRQVAPNAVFIGNDGDPWPKLQGNRIEIARKLDILTSTNNGQWLQDYRDAGTRSCFFMPNSCDPDIEHRYEVSDKWKTDILWTGKQEHHAVSNEILRSELVSRLSKLSNCAIYGCCGRPQIAGMDYFYAISGARMGVSINVDNSVRLYHSDRITHYLACGTLVLAKTVPDTNLLFRDKEHLRYFEDIDEFFELSKWYLEHEAERKKIADAGMKWIHEQFNCVRIAGYFLELIEKGNYNAPWTS